MNYSYSNFLKLRKKPGLKIKANISSSSMSPWLGIGDEVSAKVCSLNELKPFDVILYWRKNIFICHVFLRMEDGFLITKSLTENYIDPPTHQSNFLGIVHKPKFSWFHKILLRYSIRKIQ